MKFTVKYLFYGSIIALLVSVSACKNDKAITPTPTITIDIKSPMGAGSYQHGDTVKIDVEVTSDVDLHGYEWTIKTKPGGVELASSDEHVHGKTFTINDVYINNVTSTTEVELEIVAEVDHEGNERQKTVSFTLNQ